MKFKPKIIRGFSSAVYLYARYLRENHIEGIKPKAVITTAEVLFEHQRKLIEEVFNCNVYDGYGSRETSLSAQQCEAKDGYHISDENSIVEFLKDGEAVSPGESGEIIITDLHNQVMPWIRYAIEDLGTPMDEECSCGRKLSMMKSIEGRMNDIIVTPDGRRIRMPAYLFGNMEGIREIQFRQHAKNQLSVDIVKSGEFSDIEVERFLGQMKQHLGNDIGIELRFVDEIQKSSSGKKRFIISDIK